ncbi:hypothetical protein I2I11_16210 [Pontibacter sp. 172403-2]|uniref:hypothetical protein n=1 Tax=Pontibacter rufus TaxID=2791028 RepID=UPI0018AFAD04|nr:hypothetical protein [Pontibacter sp. 172403-2]MBF9254847.1 hypothetical protein [Pontibacter sp. 172403-2]
MDTTEFWDYLPGMLILLSIMTIVIIILQKFGDKIFDKEYTGSNILLFVSSFLFVTLLIVHLFKPQEWTADILKVLIGVLVGAGASKIPKKEKGEGSSVDVSGQVGGDVAGRDINKNIQHLKDAVSKIEDSIVHQNNQISQVIGDLANSDFLINTIYERGDNITGSIARVIQYWTRQGWQLRHFSSDYQGMDGIFLVFNRQMVGLEPEVYYQHGSDTKRFNSLPR